MQKMRSETTLLNPFAHTMQTYTNHILTWQCWSSSNSLHCLAKTHKIIIFFFSFSSMGTKTCPYDIPMYYVSKLNLYAWPRPICMFIPLPSGESNVDFRPWLETMNRNRINITSLLYNEYECTHRYFWQDRLHSLWIIVGSIIIWCTIHLTLYRSDSTYKYTYNCATGYFPHTI